MPWYKQFWPWFLIFFPATAVIAGISTVIIASYDSDGLVVSDYYRQGLAINQNLARQQAAEKLGLEGELHLEPDAQKLGLNLSRTVAQQELLIQLLHPTRAQKDLSTTMNKGPTGRFSGFLPLPETGRWKVMVTPPDEQWRLIGTVYFAADKTLTITLTPG